MTHQTVRRTYVLEEENRKKIFEAKKCGSAPASCDPTPLATHPTPLHEPGKLHLDYKTYSPLPSQIWVGKVHLIVQKIRYCMYRC